MTPAGIEGSPSRSAEENERDGAIMLWLVVAAPSAGLTAWAVVLFGQCVAALRIEGAL